MSGYPFPKPPGAPSDFTWDGRQFVNAAGERESVLCYTQTESHWSGDLTEFHEREAGSQHPIDQASRDLAITSIQTWCHTAEPVVLDAGCSSGFFLEDLAARMPAARLIGADYLEPPLRKLAERLQGVPLLQFDLRRCPLPDGTVDALVCLNVLEHIDDHAAAIGHIFRVLKPGGITHIEVPAGPRLYDVYDEMLMHYRRYRMAELARLAREAGFRSLRATHLGFFVFAPFALKKLWNRRALRLPPEDKKRIVAAQIRNTADSSLLRILLQMEMAMGRCLRFPFGIRCVLVLQKPG